ncbi:MAG TPA: hypothetical protein VH740_19890 [Vicinamibacterales bacterium]|jgi:hypothetical protein
MRTIVIGALLAVGLAVPARAQNTTPNEERLPRLSELRLTDLPGQTGPIQPAIQDTTKQRPDDEDEEDEECTRDSLRNGTLTGLIVGGVVGVFLVAQCGHPECGPLFSFSAGIGAALGVAIDALYTHRSVVPVDPARPRREPFDRAVAVGLRKTW